jgi:hypothetical protein
MSFTGNRNFHWPVKTPSSGKKSRGVAGEQIFGSPAAIGGMRMTFGVLQNGNKR